MSNHAFLVKRKSSNVLIIVILFMKEKLTSIKMYTSLIVMINDAFVRKNIRLIWLSADFSSRQ